MTVKNTGWSPLALRAHKTWDSKDRPAFWQGKAYGLVVHTTGGGLPTKAKKLKEYPTKTAIDHYTKNYGTHYVVGWRGKEGGELIQIASEFEQANGVGVKNTKEPEISQWHSVNERNWEKDLPKHLVEKWKNRWGHLNVSNPLKLFPTQSANSCYIHAEMIPCVYYIDNKLQIDAEPMAEGLRFTKEQHDTMIELGIDIATRDNWPLDDVAPFNWWLTGRFVGHEDITPISRSNSGGGWDPGVMRDKPFFDWDYVIKGIEAHYDLAEWEKKEVNETTVYVKPVEPVSPIDVKIDNNTDKSTIISILAKILEFLKFKE